MQAKTLCMVAELEHEHVWDPVSGWTGRYRCRGCRILGYRGLVLGEVMADSSRQSAIIPYICQAPGCRRGAVQRRTRDPETGRRRVVQRCREHLA